MIYKPEHVTDLESGAIVQAEVLESDHADTEALNERVACALEVVNRIMANEEDGVERSLTVTNATNMQGNAQLQEFDIRTVIGDANSCPALKGRLGRPAAKSSSSCRLAVKRQSVRALLRKRGMHLERSFEHVLDEGGMRRATLQGTENHIRRHKIVADY